MRQSYHDQTCSYRPGWRALSTSVGQQEDAPCQHAGRKHDGKEQRPGVVKRFSCSCAWRGVTLGAEAASADEPDDYWRYYGGHGNAACAVTPSETAGPFPVAHRSHPAATSAKGSSGTTLRPTIAVVNRRNNGVRWKMSDVEIRECETPRAMTHRTGSETGETLPAWYRDERNSSGEVMFTTVYPEVGTKDVRCISTGLKATRNGPGCQDDGVSRSESMMPCGRGWVCTVEGDEPDVQHAGRYFCGQHRFGAGHRQRRPVERIHGYLQDRDFIGAAARFAPAVRGALAGARA